jgi:hypothetical protein
MQSNSMLNKSLSGRRMPAVLSISFGWGGLCQFLRAIRRDPRTKMSWLHWRNAAKNGSQFSSCPAFPGANEDCHAGLDYTRAKLTEKSRQVSEVCGPKPCLSANQ